MPTEGSRNPQPNNEVAAIQTRVTQFLILALGNQLRAGEPVHSEGEADWMVPVLLTSRMHDYRPMEVGTIRVNAETGELKLSRNTLKEIRANCRSLRG
ncbi:MAG TPA: hypothetical protein VFB38_05230 [Chthonomonadaceae bacterium]|nr:hypothetical protein [Chthonomonadaceae bacterium]